jgi:hypothetical protein
MIDRMWFIRCHRSQQFRGLRYAVSRRCLGSVIMNPTLTGVIPWRSSGALCGRDISYCISLNGFYYKDKTERDGFRCEFVYDRKPHRAVWLCKGMQTCVFVSLAYSLWIDAGASSSQIDWLRAFCSRYFANTENHQCV